MLALLFLLSSLRLSESASNSSMIITWGKPSALNASYINGSLTWDQCVQFCSTSPPCVLAYHSTTACLIYHYNSVPPVLKTGTLDGIQVAFKVLTNGTCPIGENAPTFDNKTAQGYTYVNPGYSGWPEMVYYNYSFVNNQWVYEYQNTPACSYGFSFIMPATPDRPQMCIANYGPTEPKATAPISQAFSSGSCAELGGSLATINSKDDFNWYIYVINYYRQYQVAPNYYTRIDGVRKAACQSTPATADCVTANGFTFTDSNFLGNMDFYNWTSAPSARVANDDDCIVFAVVGTGPILNDVRSCTTLSTYQSTAHLCTKPAYT